MITAVNLRVAILAGASGQTLTGSAAGQLPCGGGLIGAKERPGMPDRQVVTLLAKVGSCRNQQLVVIGAMYGVAVGAVLAHWRMFPKERSALFGVAGVADDIGAFRLQQRLGGATVRIVTVDARHLAFRQRHVRSFVEFGALLLVTGCAGVVDVTLGEQARNRIFFHRIVAICATQLAVGVNRAGPMQLAAAFVTPHALPILSLYRCAPALGEANQQRLVCWIFRVQGTGAMAGFTNLFFSFVFRIQPKHFRMQSATEMSIFLVVAGNAGFLADVGGLLCQ